MLFTTKSSGQTNLRLIRNQNLCQSPAANAWQTAAAVAKLAVAVIRVRVAPVFLIVVRLIVRLAMKECVKINVQPLGSIVIMVVV